MTKSDDPSDYSLVFVKPTQFDSREMGYEELPHHAYQAIEDVISDVYSKKKLFLVMVHNDPRSAHMKTYNDVASLCQMVARDNDDCSLLTSDDDTKIVLVPALLVNSEYMSSMPEHTLENVMGALINVTHPSISVDTVARHLLDISSKTTPRFVAFDGSHDSRFRNRMYELRNQS